MSALDTDLHKTVVGAFANVPTSTNTGTFDPFSEAMDAIFGNRISDPIAGVTVDIVYQNEIEKEVTTHCRHASDSAIVVPEVSSRHQRTFRIQGKSQRLISSASRTRLQGYYPIDWRVHRF